jgi:hypothetical protein
MEQLMQNITPLPRPGSLSSAILPERPRIALATALVGGPIHPGECVIPPVAEAISVGRG